MANFKEKIEKGGFAVTTEIGPPKGVNLDKVFEELECVRGKVDAVNVTDQQSAVMRLGSVATSKALLEEGYDPICQITCRDRNRIALQSDILSAYVLGVRNVLIMTGDHPLLGDHPQAKPVYDLDSVAFVHAIDRLQEGKDLSGNALHGSPELCVGAVVNPGAEPLEPEIIKMEKKADAGAKFFQTQAIFDVKQFEKFLAAISHFRDNVRILGGIVPLRSAKMARYMNANIPGVVIPEKIVESLDKAKDVEAEAVAIAADLSEAIKDKCDGIHYMPIRSNHLVARILDKIKL